MKIKYNKLEKKILDEIRHRVLEESENLKKEKGRLEEEKINMEVLQEMTDLPMDRIKKIANEVKSKYKKSKKYKKHGTRFLVKLILSIILIGSIVYFIASVILEEGKRHKQDETKKEFVELTQKYSELVSSAKSGNLQMVEYLIEQGTPVDIEGYKYNTALMVASKKGYVDIVEFLLKSGADVTKKNEEFQTALDFADEGVNIRVKQIMGKAMADATPKDSSIRKLWEKNLSFSQKTFLKCVKESDLEAINLFLMADTGKFANDWDVIGMKEAAKLGNTKVLTLILEHGKNFTSDSKNIALLFAARNGQTEAIGILLDDGADINFHTGTSSSSYTPLMKALESENNRAAEYLLEKGADPNMMSGDPAMPPIMIPIHRGSYTTITDVQFNQIKLLIKYGADVNKKNEYGTLPLELARSIRYEGEREIAIMLKEAGAEVPFNESSFRHLINENDVKNIKIFLEKGFDPNLQGFEYYDKETSALMESVSLGYHGIAEALIEYGADVNLRTSGYNKTALLIAVKNEDVEMVRLLLENKTEITKDVMDIVNDYWMNDEEGNAIRKLINEAKNHRSSP